MSKQDCIKATGKIIETHSDCRYTVELDKGVSIKAQLNGKMRQNFIKCIVGDLVEVELSPYDLTHGRISKRLKEKKSKNN